MPIACEGVEAGGVSNVEGAKVFNDMGAKPYVISGEVLSEVPF